MSDAEGGDNPFDDLADMGDTDAEPKSSAENTDPESDTGTEQSPDPAESEQQRDTNAESPEQKRQNNDPSTTSRYTDSEGNAPEQSPTSNQSRPDGGSTTEGQPQSGSMASPTRTLSDSSPPFSYNQTTQQQVYLRDGLWKQLDDLKYEAEIELRRGYDVRNIEGRELDTALIQLALEQCSADEIAREVVRNRGFDPKV